MVTIRQIAKECGVSVASVSKALNGAPDIGAATAKRIRNMASTMGYHPNAAARALKTNRSHNIGVLFVDDTHCGLTHEYFSLVLNSLKNQAEQSGYDITFISQNLGGKPMTYLEHCQYRNCDGVIIANVDFSVDTVHELVGSTVPVVTIDYTFDGHSSVLADNQGNMEKLVRHVFNKGHRKIAFIHGEDTSVTRIRLKSFRDTCEALGVPAPDAYIRPAIYHDPRSSGLATRELLALADAPTCILFPDDFSYIGGMNEIERNGLKAGEDVSVAGFDGIHLAQVLRPRLTTLRQNAEALGAESVTLLCEAIESPKSFSPRSVIVPGEVSPGDSVRELPV